MRGTKLLLVATLFVALTMGVWAHTTTMNAEEAEENEVTTVGGGSAIDDDVVDSSETRRRLAEQDRLLSKRQRKSESAVKKWLALHGIKRNDVCDECQTIIAKIASIADDPQKLAELKLLLSVLCKETSYESECKLFVSRLDIFIDKLRPWLKNPKKVCQEIHLCRNARLERHQAMVRLYASTLYTPSNAVQGIKDVICEECQFAAHELDQLVQSKKFQQDAHNWVHTTICAHSGKYAGTCDLLLDDFLPEALIEIHYVLQDNHQFCADLEMCDPTTTAARRPLIGLTRARNELSESATGDDQQQQVKNEGSSSSSSSEEEAPSFKNNNNVGRSRGRSLSNRRFLTTAAGIFHSSGGASSRTVN